MQNAIDLNQPVADLLTKHPELLDLLVDLGFKPLANPAMRHTVGKVTSLKVGSKMTGIPLTKIISTLESNGYDVLGVEHE
ncbi:DUF1858 domain-containing protein [Streptococcus ovuberis]|uniref:DUF1858 domain-containing protein n=1 Tax=Streptococcus ovuberis TaxID=1936207 RepID=A0A7X6S040_9STRE|nr:DUF1858 domain-containing protein [Streptococcus ovuberis]NKZ19714.1 DUF1858 domain-containing protein [Streptococcus ovuberis]